MRKNILKKLAAFGLSMSLLSALGMIAMAEEQIVPDISQMTPEEYESYCIASRGKWSYDEDDIMIPDDITDFDEMFNSCPKGYYLMVNDTEVVGEQSYNEAKKIYNENKWWQVRYHKINFSFVNTGCPEEYGFYIDNVLATSDDETYKDSEIKFNEGSFNTLKYCIAGDREQKLEGFDKRFESLLYFYDISFDFLAKNCPDGYLLCVNNILVKDNQSYQEAQKIYNEKQWWQIMYLNEENDVNFDFIMNNCPEGYQFYVDNLPVNEESYEKLKKIYENNEWERIYYKSATREIELGRQDLQTNDTKSKLIATQEVRTSLETPTDERMAQEESITQDRQSPNTSDTIDVTYPVMLALALSIIMGGNIGKNKLKDNNLYKN